MAAETALARAKVNLFLHVTRRRGDGYHELESLAVFPAFGDELSAGPADGLSLEIAGRFAPELEAGGAGDNLIIKAARLLRGVAGRDAGAAFRLEKRLPVASGIGGGSADAAAALRLLGRLWRLSDEALAEAAPKLGADVPVCLASQPAIMEGVGERLRPAPAFPGFHMVLVNPRQALSTAEVFRAMTPDPSPAPEMSASRSLGALAAQLGAMRNDLEAPAISLRPAIGDVLAALRAAPDCAFARMSGSGATCFGLFETAAKAEAARDLIAAAGPHWWVAAAPVEASGAAI